MDQHTFNHFFITTIDHLSPHSSPLHTETELKTVNHTWLRRWLVCLTCRRSCCSSRTAGPRSRGWRGTAGRLSSSSGRSARSLCPSQFLDLWWSHTPPWEGCPPPRRHSWCKRRCPSGKAGWWPRWRGPLRTETASVHKGAFWQNFCNSYHWLTLL